jgi:hypothetical protein
MAQVVVLYCVAFLQEAVERLNYWRWGAGFEQAHVQKLTALVKSGPVERHRTRTHHGKKGQASRLVFEH